MTVTIESSLDQRPMAGMRVFAVADGFGCNGNRPLLTGECRCIEDFNGEIDALIRQLESLKPMAKAKFDEYKQ
jgi:hypothetical protein